MINTNKIVDKPNLFVKMQKTKFNVYEKFKHKNSQKNLRYLK